MVSCKNCASSEIRFPSRRSACSPATPSPAQPSLNGRWAGRAAPAGAQGGCRDAGSLGWGLTKPTKPSNHPIIQPAQPVRFSSPCGMGWLLNFILGRRWDQSRDGDYLPTGSSFLGSPSALRREFTSQLNLHPSCHPLIAFGAGPGAAQLSQQRPRKATAWPAPLLRGKYVTELSGRGDRHQLPP